MGDSLQAPAIPPQIPPTMIAAWVMEPEVPRPAGDLLQHVTKRCFAEDRVDARILIKDLTLTVAATVRIEVIIRRIFSSDLLFIGTDGLEVDANKGKFTFTEQRSLRAVSRVAEAPENDTARRILFETAGTGSESSSLATSVFVPPFPSDETVEIFFKATIIDNGVTVSAESPNLLVVRWFVHPGDNIGFGPTQATRIEPLIDGEAFFNRVKTLFDGASQRILIMSWTFWMDMFLTGEPGGTGAKLSDVLRAAAARGVKIHIMLDDRNGSWASKMLASNLSNSNIFVRLLTHPHTLFGVETGTFHEKHLSVDGKTALVGGIDFDPDRYNNKGHKFKSDNLIFKAQHKALGSRRNNNFSTPFLLWHDISVLVEGPIVSHFELDFSREWNKAKPLNGPDLALGGIETRGGGTTVQLVKTDEVGFRPGIARDPIKFQATFKAYVQALEGARRYIYIENQYLRSPQLKEKLLEVLARDLDLQLMVVIPFQTEEAREAGIQPFDYDWGLPLNTPNELSAMKKRASLHGDFLQSEFVKAIRAVSGASRRVGVYALASAVTGASQAEQIYPHSKIMIVDDTWATIGSCNTNGRGFLIDTEMGLVVHDRSFVTAFRDTLWEEHLGIRLPTRRIREFFQEWQRISLAPQDKAEACPVDQVAKVHAVKLRNPPLGQKYNGKLEVLRVADDEV